MKIYVAGHRGLVGSALTNIIEEQGEHTWTGASRAEVDLFDYGAVKRFLNLESPDAVVIAAARVGGIAANKRFPVEFLAENLRIEMNLLTACHEVDVPRVLFLGSSCIYPRLSPQPIREEYLLTGELEPTNEAYAISKIAGIKLVQAYRQQYGRHWISAMPTNLYGPRDNFDPDASHVLPAMVRRYHEAVDKNLRTVTMWGTGSPRREFLHVSDLARACLFLLENYDEEVPVNVGVGADITIKDLAEMVADIVGFSGEIHWDHSQPDGTPQKLLDISRIRSLGWQPAIALEDGIRDTYAWFRHSLGSGDAVRL